MHGNDGENPNIYNLLHQTTCFLFCEIFLFFINTVYNRYIVVVLASEYFEK